MTGQELRHIRESKGLTREQFSKEIGNCTASGIVKWEAGNPPVPQWVADKLLSKVSVTLALDELATLLTHATETKVPFDDMLTQAIRDYLTEHRAKVVPLPKPSAQGTHEENLRVAEDSPEYRIPKRKASGE